MHQAQHQRRSRGRCVTQLRIQRRRGGGKARLGQSSVAGLGRCSCQRGPRTVPLGNPRPPAQSNLICREALLTAGAFPECDPNGTNIEFSLGMPLLQCSDSGNGAHMIDLTEPRLRPIPTAPRSTVLVIAPCASASRRGASEQPSAYDDVDVAVLSCCIACQDTLKSWQCDNVPRIFHHQELQTPDRL